MVKENVKVLVEHDGEIHLFETPMAIMAFKTDEGTQMAVMGTGSAFDFMCMKESINKTIDDAIGNKEPIKDAIEDVIKGIVQNILECDGDCENCKKEGSKC